jgi:hypothetical protein
LEEIEFFNRIDPQPPPGLPNTRYYSEQLGEKYDVRIQH